MRHKWKVVSIDSTGTTSKCIVCTAKKFLGWYRYSKPTYSRSGQVYNDYIECIDLDKENQKTID